MIQVCGSDLPMWCDLGHHSPMRAVKTSNARSGGAWTITLLRTGAGSIVLFTRPPSGPIGLIRAPLDFASVREKRSFPELIQPDADRGEPVGVDAVHPPCSLRSVGHETGFFQHLQMLGHGRPADRQAARELADRGFSDAQSLEYLTARRIPERSELRHCVSHGLL
jgi:hypothetical protein